MNRECLSVFGSCQVLRLLRRSRLSESYGVLPSSATIVVAKLSEEVVFHTDHVHF